MAFSEQVKMKAMIACGRFCCLCHKFCGNNIEVHHIKSRADGGEDSFDNAVPLCFDCHANVKHYNSKHPKGTKISEKELIQHRDAWYNHVRQGRDKNTEQEGYSEKNKSIKIYRQKDYQDIMLCKVSTGKEIINYLLEVYGIDYNEEVETLEDAKLVGDFIQNIKEILDFDDLLVEPCDRVMVAFNLTESIKELDRLGFWVFVGKENRVIIDSIGDKEIFPVLLLRVVKKSNNDIIKVKFENK